MNYYNEIDPFAAAWLRNLIAAGHLPAGVVDERSIVDVRATDLVAYAQCHFFAGVGGWPLAARLAGWPDDRPLWTGSCPCQPFSVAGKQRGQADARHLWPEYFRLIRECRPASVMGEQVAAAVGKDWLDGVCADLEGIGYAIGAAVAPACAVNAPHRRDRLWFVAGRGAVGDRLRKGLEGQWRDGDGATGWPQSDRPTAAAGGDGDVADAASDGRQQGQPAAAAVGHRGEPAAAGGTDAWRHADWVVGHDGKARRIPSDESGVRLPVDGLSPWVDGMRASGQTASRTVALKGLGNAIVPPLAAEVIAAFMDCMGE